MRAKRIWIDIDNSPHVLFFKPIAERLRQSGHQVFITARSCAQTHDLLRLHGIDFVPLGRHYGKHTLSKVFGLGIRSLQLLRFARREQIDLAVSHGSRSLVWTAYMMRIPSVTLYDYEYVFAWLFNKFSTKVLIPELVPDEVLSSMNLDLRKVFKYHGLKEEVYLGDFRPDPDIYRRLDIDADSILVTLRPPATAAHYHDPRSERLFDAVLRHVLSWSEVAAVVLPRTEQQRESLLRSYPDRHGLHILEHPVDGLNLLWHSDIVIGGGGTINREAALLGVPVFSIFSGKQGAVDRSLVEQGKLRFLKSVDDIQNIIPQKRMKTARPPGSSQKVIDEILREILNTS